MVEGTAVAGCGAAISALMLFVVAFILPLLFFGFFLLVGVACTVFWIWMLVDCLKHEPTDKGDNVMLIWVLLLIFTHVIGALLYYLIRRPERKRLYGK